MYIGFFKCSPLWKSETTRRRKCKTELVEEKGIKGKFARAKVIDLVDKTIFFKLIFQFEFYYYYCYNCAILS